jgi:hypothetical protein
MWWAGVLSPHIQGTLQEKSWDVCVPWKHGVLNASVHAQTCTFALRRSTGERPAACPAAITRSCRGSPVHACLSASFQCITQSAAPSHIPSNTLPLTQTFWGRRTGQLAFHRCIHLSLNGHHGGGDEGRSLGLSLPNATSCYWDGSPACTTVRAGGTASAHPCVARTALAILGVGRRMVNSCRPSSLLPSCLLIQSQSCKVATPRWPTNSGDRRFVWFKWDARARCIVCVRPCRETLSSPATELRKAIYGFQTKLWISSHMKTFCFPGSVVSVPQARSARPRGRNAIQPAAEQKPGRP